MSDSDHSDGEIDEDTLAAQMGWGRREDDDDDDVPDLEEYDEVQVGDDDDDEYDDDDEDEYDDDDDDDDADSIASGTTADFMMHDHPMMERIQAAFKETLTKNLETATLELREKTEEVRKMKIDREQLGVQLYSQQQQLAKLQLKREAAIENFNHSKAVREQLEEEVKGFQESLKDLKAEVQAGRSAVTAKQADLDKLNATIKGLEQFNEGMKNQIAVTRRATYKAEESISNMEKGKATQDELLDRLTEEVRTLQDKLALYEAQLISQKQETSVASETLADAGNEMEAINFEKKMLVQQWKSSLIALERRDENLKDLENQVRAQWEESMSLDGEISANKRLIAKEQEENEKLTGILNKIKGDFHGVERMIKAAEEKKAKMVEEYNMYKISLEQTEEEMQRVSGERNILKSTLASLNRENEQAAARIRELEIEIRKNLSTQTTLQKSTQNVTKAANKIDSAVNEKEIEAGKLENELQRIRVDILNTQSHNQQLDSTKLDLLKELKEKDDLIEKYTTEIRRRNDVIEKKQSEVDRLNRRYDHLVSNMEDENLGPLEATIHNLTKSISEKQQECQDMQHVWLKRQTDLVALTRDINEKNEAIQELRSQITILTQRRVRLDKQFTGHATEIKEMEASIRQLHNDTVRLNTLITDQSGSLGNLAESNLTLETSMVNNIKDQELESVQLEAKIDALRDEKDAMLNELVEVERQIMLWEKKIQLAKETQEALDPNFGMAEVKAMKKLIHRMELDYTKLQGEQEKLVKEMERSIYKREMISDKYRTKKGTVTNTATLKKQIVDIGKRLTKAVGDAKRCDEEIKRVLEAQKAVGAEVEDATEDYRNLRSQKAEVQREVQWTGFQKQKGLEKLSRVQERAKKYSDLKRKAQDGTLKVMSKEKAVKVETSLQAEIEKTAQIRAVLERLGTEFPDLNGYFGNMIHSIDQDAMLGSEKDGAGSSSSSSKM